MLSLRQEFEATFVGIILWIIIAPIVGPPFLICFTFSCIVHLLAKLFHPELIPLSKVDAFITIAPSNTPLSYMYACQIWRVKGLIDVDAFRNHFYQCFLSTGEDRQRYRNLYCHFVEYLGYIFKKRVKQIDLQWHIHEHHLKEGDSIEKFIGKWMVTHDKSALGPEVERPAWMIKIFQDPLLAETTIAFKLHHGICDGYTIVHLVDKLSGQRSPYIFKEREPSLPRLIKTMFQCPYQILRVWHKLYRLRKEKKFLRDIYEANTHQSPTDTKDWLISFCSLDLETVKGIRRVTRTNFVSVLMSIQIGALRRFLTEVNPNARLLRDIPSELFVGHSMGWPNHPVPMSGGGMGNHLTINLIKASFHMNDPLERLRDLDKNFRETKSNGFPILAYYAMFNMMKHFPAWLVRHMIQADLSVLAAENGLSSLLGSTNQHFLLGHQVENIWLPVVTSSSIPTLKLMTVPFSHSGKLDVSVNADTSFINNQETLDRFVKVHFVQELESLRIRCQQLVE